MNKQILFNVFSSYFKTFVEDIIGLKNAQFHNEIDDIISNEIYKKIVIAIARGHGKSTHLSVCYPLWEIAKDHNVRILLISSTATIAAGFVTEIINHIEGNEKYIEWAEAIDKKHEGVRPKMRKLSRKEEKWTSAAFTVDRDNLSLKDPTITALGLFGSILSKRADVIIIDDLVNQQNSETEEQREKIKDWVYTTLMPVLVPGGRFIYLGNTWHMNDLVADLLKDPQFDFKLRLPAIEQEAKNKKLWYKWAAIVINETIPVEDRKKQAEKYYQDNKPAMVEGVKVLWPDMYTYKDLYLKRLSNSYAFSRMYQCDPSDRPDQKFLEIWLTKAKRKGRHLRLQDKPREGIEVDITTSGLDLAISKEEYSDDTALLTIDRVKYGAGLIEDGDIVIRNIDRGKMTAKETRDMVKEHNAIVQPAGIKVETNAYQESMLRDLQEFTIPITGHKTGGEKNDIEIGINSLAILAEMGKLVIPYDLEDPRTIQLSSKLVDEMRSWPEGHTGDSLMALWFAWLEMRDFQSQRFIVPSIMGKHKAPKVPVNVHSAEERKPLEKEADIEAIKEQEYERSEFWRQMRRRM